MSDTLSGCYLIAEIGFNHAGDMALAAEMIRAAAAAGADAVKFQTFRACDIALPSSEHYRDIQAAELSFSDHVELAKVARDSGVDFLSTAFSPWAVDLLEKIGVRAYKVASMDCTNKYLLGHIAATKKPIFLSTGMASLEEIADSLAYLQAQQSGPVTLLHCVSLYPARPEQLNLQIIPLLKQRFSLPVGYSDHYPGTDAALAAVMLGAEVIETHFTLDSSQPGADHCHSAEPSQLKQLVAKIKLFQIMRGSAEAIENRPDRPCAESFRRGLYAARDLPAGHRLRSQDLLMCRPASSLTPNDLPQLLGKTLAAAVPAYTPLCPQSISPQQIAAGATQ